MADVSEEEFDVSEFLSVIQDTLQVLEAPIPSGKLPPVGESVLDLLEDVFLTLDRMPLFEEAVVSTVPFYPPSCLDIAPENFFAPEEEFEDASPNEVAKTDTLEQCLMGSKCEDAVERVEKKTHDAEESFEDKTDDAGESDEERTHDVGESVEKKTHDAVESVEEKTHDAGESVEEKTDHAGERVEEKMHDIGESLESGESDVLSVNACDIQTADEDSKSSSVDLADPVMNRRRVDLVDKEFWFRTNLLITSLVDPRLRLRERLPYLTSVDEEDCGVLLPSARFEEKRSLSGKLCFEEVWEEKFEPRAHCSASVSPFPPSNLLADGKDVLADLLCLSSVDVPTILEETPKKESDAELPAQEDTPMILNEQEKSVFGRGMVFSSEEEESVREKERSEESSLGDILFPSAETSSEEIQEQEPAAEETEDTSRKLPILKGLRSCNSAGTSEGGAKYAIPINLEEPSHTGLHRQPYPPYVFPFPLDPFQEEALKCVDNGCSVMVSAHTSAGKTVVAEYAISLCLRNRTRAIYTSPIKALSNQKFRDFYNTFQDVGLLTGDSQINETASCLIMTTEILRSMLYNGHHIVPDIQWVIFDECHYINDSERGVVWEEVLIMLPPSVSVILLSATVPNVLQFADWVGRIRKTPVYVVSTPKRPVPLEHYLYTGCGGKSKTDCFPFLRSDGKFDTEGYEKAQAKIQERKANSFGEGSGYSEKQEKTMWVGLVSYLKQQDQLPVVAFTLSRNRCDSNANLLDSVDLISAKQKGEVRNFLQKSLSILKKKDRMLPQVLRLSEFLMRGIGVHHSGILPILKEAVEILFGKGLVQLLFATETFAMGVNMPARTVVFDDFRKFDGKGWRDLYPSEYIQMAGRAGRRGLDTVGKVVLVCKKRLIDVQSLTHMATGKPAALESQFRVTYSMVLSVLRSESMKMEDMMQRSFLEAQKEKQRPILEKRLQEQKQELESLPNLSCALCNLDICRFYDLGQSILEMREKLSSSITSAAHHAHLLSPGRVIFFSSSSHNLYHYPGVLVSASSKEDTEFKVLTLLEDGLPKDNLPARCAALASLRSLIPCRTSLWSSAYTLPAEASTPFALSVAKKDVLAVGKETLKVSGKTLVPTNDKLGIEAMQYSFHSANLSRLDPKCDLGLKSVESVFQLNSLVHFERELAESQCVECPSFSEHLLQYFKRRRLGDQVSEMERNLSHDSLLMLPDYALKQSVLARLGYIREGRRLRQGCPTLILTHKGHAACELGTHDVLISQLLFSRFWEDYSPSELAGLLSGFVFQGKGEDESAEGMPESLLRGIELLKKSALQLGEAEVEAGYEGSALDRLEELNFGLSRICYEWARGIPFVQLMQDSYVQEGLVIRTIQRLEELVRDLRTACGVVGNTVLKSSLREVSDSIRRDIVFAPSLYTREVEEDLQGVLREAGGGAASSRDSRRR